MKKNYTLDKVIWFQPDSGRRYMILIPNKRFMNIGLHLRKELPEKLDVGFDPDDSALFIRAAQTEECYNVLTGDSIHSKNLIAKIVAHGRQPSGEIPHVQMRWFLGGRAETD